MSRTFRMAALSGMLMASVAISPVPSSAQADEQSDASFGERVRTYLLENPEIIVEALGAYENKKRSEEISRIQEKVSGILDRVHSDDAPYIGDATGKSRIAIFSDYACPHCRTANKEIRKVLEAENDLRVNIHEFPILGPESESAARYALAILDISGPEDYASVHDSLFGTGRPVTEASLKSDAESRGLSWDEVREAMMSENVSPHLSESRSMADIIGILGTPFMVIGNTAVPGTVSSEVMMQILREGSSL